MAGWKSRLSRDPAVCHGAVCVKGTRIMVSIILDNLAAGADAEEIRALYPKLKVADVQAAQAYAAALARDEYIPWTRPKKPSRRSA